MEDTTVETGTEGFVFDVGSLWARLLDLPDQRQARGKRYSLALVLLLMILAKLCGEDTPYGIAEWARLRGTVLVVALGLRRPTLPSHNTYRRVMSHAVVPAAMQRMTTAFLTQVNDVSRSVLVTIDGKTLRGAIPSGQSQGVHLLAAYLPDVGIVLMQLVVGQKENEIVAAPHLLATLDRRGKVVRGDAMLTHRALSVQIVDSGGDYLWLVKGNQSQLLADIQEVFHPAPSAPGWQTVSRDLRSAQTVNSGHGRLEKRTLTASTFLQSYTDWPGLAQVFKLEREVTVGATGVSRQEVVYGITSLSTPVAPPDRLWQLMRDYWGIENGLHYRRDKTLREDNTRLSHPQQAEVLAILNNFIIGLVRWQGFDNLAAARRYFCAHVDAALSLLLASPS